MAKGTCSLSDCDRPHYGHGLCNMHYQRKLRTGTTDAPPDLCKRGLHEFTPENTYIDPLGKRNCRTCTAERLAQREAPACKIDGCESMTTKRGWCEMHYQRWRKTGDPGPAEPGRHTPGTLHCTVDACDRSDYYAKGLCSVHYQRVFHHGSTDLIRVVRPDSCVVGDCTAEVLAQGLCRLHYLRMWRTGTVADPVPVTHCAKGHEFTAENTVIYSGKKYCRTCQAAKGAARRAWMDETQTEPVDYGKIIEMYGMVCHICGGDILTMDDLHRDHVIPRARGGTHTYDNIRPAHARCNLRKHVKLMEELALTPSA